MKRKRIVIQSTGIIARSPAYYACRGYYGLVGRRVIDAINSGQIKIVGEPRKASELFSLFDTFHSHFEIVEP